MTPYQSFIRQALLQWNGVFGFFPHAMHHCCVLAASNRLSQTVFICCRWSLSCLFSLVNFSTSDLYCTTLAVRCSLSDFNWSSSFSIRSIPLHKRFDLSTYSLKFNCMRLENTWMLLVCGNDLRAFGSDDGCRVIVSVAFRFLFSIGVAVDDLALVCMEAFGWSSDASDAIIGMSMQMDGLLLAWCSELALVNGLLVTKIGWLNAGTEATVFTLTIWSTVLLLIRKWIDASNGVSTAA